MLFFILYYNCNAFFLLPSFCEYLITNSVRGAFKKHKLAIQSILLK